jgi:hypothetical protein
MADAVTMPEGVAQTDIVGMSSAPCFSAPEINPPNEEFVFRAAVMMSRPRARPDASNVSIPVGTALKTFVSCDS